MRCKKERNGKSNVLSEARTHDLQIAQTNGLDHIEEYETDALANCAMKTGLLLEMALA